MDELARLRACNYRAPLVERMGIIEAVLRGTRAPEGLWEIFEHLPNDDLDEAFGLLLQYYVPERVSLHAFLNMRPPLVVAMAPAHTQIGYMRSQTLWNEPAPAPREGLWDYLMFRWCVQYFDRTMRLFMKSLPDDVALLFGRADLHGSISVVVATIVASHGALLDDIEPRVCAMLRSPYFCRDSYEYHELLLLAQYVLMSRGDLPAQIPFDVLFQWGAGRNMHIQSETLKRDALLTVASAGNQTLESWVRQCTDPDFITSLCRIITEMPADINYIAILALSFTNLLIDINWDMHSQPYLYERTAHVLLGAQPNSASYILHAVLASHLLQRLALVYPRRNIIETCFYTFTAVLQHTKSAPVFRHQIEENLRNALKTVGNRECFIHLVGMQEGDVQNEWSILFPSLQWPVPAGPVVYDAVTEQPIVRAWHFAEGDTTPVSLETILRHVAMNGLRNPFTNVPLTWPQLLRVNQAWL